MNARKYRIVKFCVTYYVKPLGWLGKFLLKRWAK